MHAEINGIRMGYDDTGTGPAVVLIHGYPLSRAIWQPQAEALAAAGYRVVTPDLRGFGESEPGNAPGAMDLLADDVVALLNHLDLPRAVIGGMSMGGYVVLNMLARHRERATGALFMVTRADADDEAVRARRDNLIAEVAAGRPEAVPDAFTPLLFAPGTLRDRPELVTEVRAIMDATPPRGLVLGLEAIRDRVDSRPLLPALDLPALVIGARADTAIPSEKSTEIADAVPNAQLHLIEEAGHMVNMERADACNQALLEFLGKL